MAAPTLLGNLQEYHPDSETFSAYLERMTLFFTANAIPDDKKVAVFLTVIGSQTYSLVRSLVAPTLPQDNSLEDLVDVLKRHFEPKPLVIAERFHFHKRAQAVGESIAEYMAELRRLTTHCNYRDHLEEALRDRLVCGIRDVDTQRKLLAVPDLTLKKALEIAQGSEAAVNMAKSLKVVDTSINTVTKAKVKCYRCGKMSHTANDCKFRDVDCHHCGKHGHIAAACRAKKAGKPPFKRTYLPRETGQAQDTKYVTAAQNKDLPPGVPAADEEELHLYSVNEVVHSAQNLLWGAPFCVGGDEC